VAAQQPRLVVAQQQLGVWLQQPVCMPTAAQQPGFGCEAEWLAGKPQSGLYLLYL